MTIVHVDKQSLSKGVRDMIRDNLKVNVQLNETHPYYGESGRLEVRVALVWDDDEEISTDESYVYLRSTNES